MAARGLPDRWPVLRQLRGTDPLGRGKAARSERKRLIWWDREQRRWTGYDTPDFPREKAPDTPARDALVLLFVVGGVIGVTASLLNIAVANAATFGYCDCGYKTEEVIAQDYALTIGRMAGNWLSIGAVTLVGVGTALAGRLLNFSPSWRLVSYAIALLLLFAAGLRLLAAFVFIEAFDPFQLSDILTAIAAGILVPIWAILLARGIGGAGEEVTA
jgi:hypothetical protein